VTRSALVVVVPDAEPLVGDHRLAHDPMTGRGVPAHVTILHPFRPVVDETSAAEVAAIAARFAPFRATFAASDRFPGVVLFLVPEPVERFVELSRACIEAFPDCPPYGGAFPDPNPHLTIGIRLDESTAADLERAITPSLPISTTVDRLTLLVEDDDGQWSVGRSWPLGRGAA
jgi:hypothetical protein